MELLPDSYRTITNSTEVETRVKGSRFIGRLFPIDSRDDAERILGELRKKEHTATHHCFAYHLRSANLKEGDTSRYSDDGEPSGSAGRPIQDQLSGAKITNALIVVTRYYGGTKLGVGGLVRAYSEAAELALKDALIVERFDMLQFSVVCEMSVFQQVQRLIAKLTGVIVISEFSDVAAVKVKLRKSLADQFEREFVELTHGRGKIKREVNQQ